MSLISSVLADESAAAGATAMLQLSGFAGPRPDLPTDVHQPSWCQRRWGHVQANLQKAQGLRSVHGHGRNTLHLIVYRFHQPSPV